MKESCLINSSFDASIIGDPLPLNALDIYKERRERIENKFNKRYENGLKKIKNERLKKELEKIRNENKELKISIETSQRVINDQAKTIKYYKDMEEKLKDFALIYDPL